MNNPRTKKKMNRSLPFVMEFVKFAAGFAAIIALALIALRFTNIETQVAAVIHFW